MRRAVGDRCVRDRHNRRRASGGWQARSGSCWFLSAHALTDVVAEVPLELRPPDRFVVSRIGFGVRRERDADETDQEAERSEEHTSELQSRQYLVCRLLL